MDERYLDLQRNSHPYIHEANQKAGWNFDWDWSESCQFTKYGVGQYYGWHCDSWDKPYSRLLADGTDQLTMVKLENYQ